MNMIRVSKTKLNIFIIFEIQFYKSDFLYMTNVYSTM